MIEYKTKNSNHPDIVQCVLENRNLTTEDVNEILNPSIEEYDGLQLKNMNEAISMLNDNINKGVVCGTVIDPDC